MHADREVMRDDERCSGCVRLICPPSAVHALWAHTIQRQIWAHTIQRQTQAAAAINRKHIEPARALKHLQARPDRIMHSGKALREMPAALQPQSQPLAFPHRTNTTCRSSSGEAYREAVQTRVEQHG